MSTGFIVNNGPDVYDIFEIYFSGTKAAATGFVANNANYPVATDLCNILTPVGTNPYSTNSRVSATGFVANNANYTTAKDLNAIFCPAMYFKVNGTNYRWDRNNDCSLNTIYGYPPPSIYSKGFTWCYINITKAISGFTTFKGYRISLDMYENDNSLSNICFGCNTNGNGTTFRCESRGADYSGIAPCSGWGLTTPPTSADGIALAANTWHNILISVYDNGYCNYVYDGIVWGTYFSFADTGTYLGYSGELDGGYVQNIYLIQPIFDGTFTNWTNSDTYPCTVELGLSGYFHNGIYINEPGIAIQSYDCWMYRNVSTLVPGLTTFKGCKILFQILPGDIFSFMFGCNSSGNGTRIAFDSGTPNRSGITTCTAWNSSYTNPAESKPSYSFEWYLVDITIFNSGSIRYTVNGTLVYFSLTAFSDQGTYIGIYGTGYGVDGGYMKNINIFRSIFNGTFTGWTNNGSSIVTLSSELCIYCNGGNIYCFTDAATVVPNLVNLLGYVVTFEMYITGQYLNVHIGVDSGGAGTFFRLETRSDRFSGIAQISGWTGFYGFPSGVAPSTANAWHNIYLYIKNDNTIEYTIDGGSVNTYNAYTNNGTYVGVSTGGQAGYVRNIYIYKKSLILP